MEKRFKEVSKRILINGRHGDQSERLKTPKDFLGDAYVRGKASEQSKLGL